MSVASELGTHGIYSRSNTMTTITSERLPSAIAQVTKVGGSKRFQDYDADSDNFSFCDGDGVRVEERLQLNHLEELMYWFQTHKPPVIQTAVTALGHPVNNTKVPSRQPGLLLPDEFKDTLVKVLGTHDFDDQLDSLFMKLDTSCDGYVDWNEFCTYMLLQFRENDYLRAKKILPFQSEPKIRHIVHNRQETTTKVVAVDNPLKYVTISKDGNISVFDHNLHFEKHYTMTDGEDSSTGSQRRKIKYWVTDALYMPNSHKIAIASSGRDIRFFDVTSSFFYEEFILKLINKDGNISVFDHNLHFEKHYTMTDGEDSSTGSQRRKIKYWVTDALYMPNSHKIAIASSGRDIRFFDVTSSFFYEEFILYGMPDVPTCFDYYYKEKQPAELSMLIYGDDKGAINMLHFSKPMTQLFEMPFQKKEGVQKIYFPELPTHSAYVRHTQLLDIHPETVRRIQYQPGNDCILSSSASSRNSLVMIDIERKKKSYIWKLLKGIECFDYNKNLNVLVTGTSDHLLRLWNPYVVNKPVAVLEGHAMGIIDVKLHEGLAQIFSLSRDATLKVWDIKEQACLQTIGIKFPSSLLGRMPEYGSFAMHLQLIPGRSLLVTANDYITQLKLGTMGLPKLSLPTTHLTQLCCAIYNPIFQTVVTGADDSSVAVWDFQTGAKSMLFANTHGQEEITCMTFDNSWRRLFTGARNGTVKVWNIQNGHNLHEYEAIEENEITGIVSLSDKKMSITVGWNRMITQYDDSDADVHRVKAIRTWKAGVVHKEDILAIANMPPQLMATASFDGEINIWNLDTESLYLKLRKGHNVDMSSNMYSMIMGQFLRPLTAQSCPSSNNTKQANSAKQYANNKLEISSSTSITQPQTTTPSKKNSLNRENNVSSRPSSNRGSRPNSRHRKSHKPPIGLPAPVDKLLYLNARTEKYKRTEAAILVSSEGGILRFWSIYYSKHQQGNFYAPDTNDDCVLGLATSPDNKYLISGDTSGKVSVWNIEEYCVQPSDQMQTEKPEKVFSWQAHDSSIVSVDFVNHEVHGQFVITASTDFTAKLFTIQGFCVGTFGQKMQWNLKNPATWLEPHSDFLEMNESENRSESPVVSDDDFDGDNDIDGPVRESTRVSIPVLEKGDTLTEDEIPDDLDTMLPSLTKTPKPATAGPRLSTNNLNNADLKIATRSQTFHVGGGYRRSKPYKSLLGSTIDDHWSRVTKDRQVRRENLEKGFHMKKHNNLANKMSKICCPYQSMPIPELNEIELPKDLPLSPRMINRGMNSETIKLEDLLASMDTTSNDSIIGTDLNMSQDWRGAGGGTRLSLSHQQLHRTSVASATSVRLPAIKRSKTTMSNRSGVSTILGGNIGKAETNDRHLQKKLSIISS